MLMHRFEYVNVKSVSEALTQLRSTNAVAKAGGVDLLDLMKEGIAVPERLINLRTINELKFVRDDPASGLHIGPLVSLAQLGIDEVVSKKYAALSQAANGAATPQIRNSATLGGNLCQRPRCWYFRSSDFHCLRKGGDTCFAQEGENTCHAIFDNQLCAIVHPSSVAVALSAFHARLKLVGNEREWEMPVEEFFVRPETDVQRENILKPDELITEVIVPKLLPGTSSYYLKLREKQSFDWPLADVAVVLQLDDDVCREASIVLGAAAPVPWRVPEAEQLMNGKKISYGLAKEAAELALHEAAPMRDNKHKVQVFKAAVRRTILLAAGKDPLA